MTPVFNINFRREAYRLERDRTRRRTFAVAVWLAYYGVLAVILGLYGLNCASLSQRTRLLEAQNARAGAQSDAAVVWKPGPAELNQIEQALASPQRWRVRLERLAARLPVEAMLTSVTSNPDNLSGSMDQERLQITGVLRSGASQDGMKGIMTLVAALHSDSLFSAQYRTIRLVESRIGRGVDAAAEFRIECR